MLPIRLMLASLACCVASLAFLSNCYPYMAVVVGVLLAPLHVELCLWMERPAVRIDDPLYSFAVFGMPSLAGMVVSALFSVFSGPVYEGAGQASNGTSYQHVQMVMVVIVCALSAVLTPATVVAVLAAGSKLIAPNGSMRVTQARELLGMDAKVD